MQPKKPGQERLAWVPEQIFRGSCGFITTPGCGSSKAPVPLPRLRGPRNQVASGQQAGMGLMPCGLYPQGLWSRSSLA